VALRGGHLTPHHHLRFNLLALSQLLKRDKFRLGFPNRKSIMTRSGFLRWGASADENADSLGALRWAL